MPHDSTGTGKKTRVFCDSALLSQTNTFGFIVWFGVLTVHRIRDIRSASSLRPASAGRRKYAATVVLGTIVVAFPIDLGMQTLWERSEE